jgi:hypothetical protein
MLLVAVVPPWHTMALGFRGWYHHSVRRNAWFVSDYEPTFKCILLSLV